MGGGKSCCGVCTIVGWVVAIGAINWGLVGLLQMDLIAKFLGQMTTAARVAYGVVGLAGILKILSLLKVCPCQKGSCESK